MKGLNGKVPGGASDSRRHPGHAKGWTPAADSDLKLRRWRK
jgi:hypothetical protein